MMLRFWCSCSSSMSRMADNAVLPARCQYHPAILTLVIGFILWVPLQWGFIIWEFSFKLSGAALAIWILHFAMAPCQAAFWIAAILGLCHGYHPRDYLVSFLPSSNQPLHMAFVVLLFSACMTPVSITLLILYENVASPHIALQIALDGVYLAGYVIAAIVARRTDQLVIRGCCWPELPGTTVVVDDREMVCPICLEEYRPHEKVLRSACGHTSHRQCLRRAVEATGKMECPYCRQHLEKAVLLSKN